VSVVQPNIHDKFASGTAEEQEELLLSLVAQVPQGVDFIVLPETAIPHYRYDERWLQTARPVRAFAQLLAREYPGTMLVAGANTAVYYPDGNHPETARRDPARHDGRSYYDAFNSALAIDSTGVGAIHHKGRLVIGVENTPTWIFKALKFLVIDLGGTVGQLGIGEAGPVFRNRGTAVGPAICYEGLYGDFFGQFVRDGAQAMLISSNDCWWGDTPGHRHLFSIARLRAVEHRRAIARSANTGTSGFIDTRGDVRQKLGWDRRGILTDSMELNSRLTFYTRYGDYLGRIAQLLMGLCLLYYLAYRIKKKNHLIE
ncbi:MAG: apolipoprotein N-acyltransferase, partial [Alistipes sp.]|nr:apolipoprotein N-acyltransferase [Alistipes sp.]